MPESNRQIISVSELNRDARRLLESEFPMLFVEGENEGSWDPTTPTPDLWARYGGRLYVTTMNLLSLEVTYRHLPLYDATGFKGEYSLSP